MCPRQELNLHLLLRREVFYPLDYEGKFKDSSLQPAKRIFAQNDQLKQIFLKTSKTATGPVANPKENDRSDQLTINNKEETIKKKRTNHSFFARRFLKLRTKTPKKQANPRGRFQLQLKDRYYERVGIATRANREIFGSK